MNLAIPNLAPYFIFHSRAQSLMDKLIEAMPNDEIGILSLRSSWDVLQQLGWKIIPVVMHGLLLLATFMLLLAEVVFICAFFISNLLNNNQGASLAKIKLYKTLVLLVPISSLCIILYLWLTAGFR